MVPAPCHATDPVPPPAYQRALAKRRPALHIDAVTLVERCPCAAWRCGFFRLQRPPLAGWAAVTTRVALTYTAAAVALAAHDAGRSGLIRPPNRVLAHCWEGLA